ncbi:MAG TPA: phytoene/squalene synthase family protein [Tepidisphaeraceae bacterium]|nr:phytoene/squalene synthase family protein [Tepidisphaeraceae bacterium]
MSVSQQIVEAGPVDRWVARAVGGECREQARNVYLASFFLPARKRVAVQAVGAFVHMLEEALDVEGRPGAMEGACASGSDLEGRVGLVSERLASMYGGEICPPSVGGEASQAVIHVVAGAIGRYQIPKEWFLELVEGLKTAATALRFATWAALERYLRRRGGSVGLILSAMLGLTDSDGQERAVELGMAVELTRILRDLKRDGERNRIFLPLEDLIRFRYGEKELRGSLVNERFRELMRFEVERARGLYRSGAAGICWVGGDGSRLAAATMAVLYGGLLRGMERRGYDVFGGEMKLNAGQRMRRMVDAWRLARRRVGEEGVRGWERR